MDTGITLQDPGTGVNANGYVTLAEIVDSSLDDLLVFQTPQITGSGRLPLVGQSESFDINGVLGIDPNHPFTEFEEVEQPVLIEDGPEIHISVTSNPLDISVTTNEDFDQIIDGFQHFSIDSICEAIEQIIDLLDSSDIAIFNEELPLINQSINDLLEPGRLLQTIIDVLCADPEGLRTQVQQIVNEHLTKTTAPMGAIPVIFPHLNTAQMAEMTELYDSLIFALGTDDIAQVPSLLSGVMAGFRRFIDALPGSIDSAQLSSVIGQIEDLLPSADGLEATIEDALGLAPNDFKIEFVDADGNLMTPGLAAIVRLTLDVSFMESVPLDFDFDIGGDILPVDIQTGGDLDRRVQRRTLQLDFGVNLSEGVPLADRVFLVGLDDKNTFSDRRRHRHVRPAGGQSAGAPASR